MRHIVVASLILAVACVVEGSEANTGNDVRRSFITKLIGVGEQQSLDSSSFEGGHQFLYQNFEGVGDNDQAHELAGIGIGHFLGSYGLQNSDTLRDQEGASYHFSGDASYTENTGLHSQSGQSNGASLEQISQGFNNHVAQQQYPVAIKPKVSLPQLVAVLLPHQVTVVPVPKPGSVPRPAPVTVTRVVPDLVQVPEPVEEPHPEAVPISVRQNIVVPVPQSVSAFGGTTSTHYDKLRLAPGSLVLNGESKPGFIVLQPLTSIHQGDLKPLGIQTSGQNSIDYTGISSGVNLQTPPQPIDTGKTIYLNLNSFEGTGQNDEHQPLWQWLHH